MGLFAKKKEEEVMDVFGMTCDHCVSRVTAALEGTKGVKDVSVGLEPAADYRPPPITIGGGSSDPPPGHARVSYDPGRTDVDAMMASVADAGYEARRRVSKGAPE